MTYQRNMKEGAAALKNCLDDGVPDGVEQPEISARDDHEPERHRGALAHLAPIRPLDAAQLGVGRAHEVRRAAEDALAMHGLMRVTVVLVVLLLVGRVRLAV